MQFFFKALYKIRTPLRKSYYDGITKIDYVIANSATLPIVSAIAERQGKKVALSYFMPPVVPTSEFPLSDFDFFNFPWYNKLTYKITQSLYWKIVKKETNEYRQELGLPVLKESLIRHIDKQKPLDLYCISPSLIPQPKDWESHHKITGFLTIPTDKRENHLLEATSSELDNWLAQGEKPVYIGFGSNGVGNVPKVESIIAEILDKTDIRILFCTGWALFNAFPKHKNIYVTKYVNHEKVLPKCRVGVFHGGAGTLAAMLRNNLPTVIVSFYTDQPTWGKIIEKKKLGTHIPVKKLDTEKLLSAIQLVQTDEIKNNVSVIGQKIRNENGLENAVKEIESYFAE